MDEALDDTPERFERARQWIIKGLSTPSDFPPQLEIISDLIERGETKFKTLREFVTAPINHDGLGIKDNERLNLLLWYNPHHSHVSKRLSAKLGIAELARETEAIGFKGKNSDTPSDTGSPKQYGNSNAYRISVLKRDHPEIAKRLEAGEIKSVIEAERLAGTKPPKRKGKRVVCFEDDVNGAMKALSEIYEVEAMLKALGEIEAPKIKIRIKMPAKIKAETKEVVDDMEGVREKILHNCQISEGINEMYENLPQAFRTRCSSLDLESQDCLITDDEILPFLEVCHQQFKRGYLKYAAYTDIGYSLPEPFGNRFQDIEGDTGEHMIRGYEIDKVLKAIAKADPKKLSASYKKKKELNQ